MFGGGVGEVTGKDFFPRMVKESHERETLFIQS